MSISIEHQSSGIDKAVLLHNWQTLQSSRGAVFADGGMNGPRSSRTAQKQHKNIFTSSSTGSFPTGDIDTLFGDMGPVSLERRDCGVSAKWAMLVR
jgi:hypothetical protein